MEKSLIEIVNLLAVIAVVSIPVLKLKAGSILTLCIITLQVILNSMIAVSVFSGGSLEYLYAGSSITGPIPFRIDYLSAWFILVISFTFLTGAWYGAQYLKYYSDQEDNLKLHFTAFVLLYTSLIDICLVQNSLVLLVVWEIMALSSFVAVIFEHNKRSTLKAGINFLIQSHVCILFLTMAFLWVKVKTGSFDFNAISSFTSSQVNIAGFTLFILFFIGFGIKAGFVPFHTWLPLAHPAAPAHISGIMSGVIIKIGIYGIMRVLVLFRSDMLSVGYLVLFISVITGIYGVMLAILQHNLKKLLAYHSIENIGIIGIGMGLGCLGMGYNQPYLVAAGFGGALLHVFNHSLFKSLLFFSAGNVYQSTHTMNIESLGGLIKKVPHSAYMFLIGSLAICGLPPFNGFISEFFIYNGLFHGLVNGNFKFILFILFSIHGLVIIGGLALLCFTKAFGTVFLGASREKLKEEKNIETRFRLYPMYLIAAAIVLIGIFPFLLSPYLNSIISVFQSGLEDKIIALSAGTFSQLTIIGWYSLGFIFLTGIIFLLRQLVSNKGKSISYETWGCGYSGPAKKMQYTASSFVRTYRKLAEPVLLIKKEKTEARGLYPNIVQHTTHLMDKMENILIDKSIRFVRRFLNSFVFLQNGKIQAYILYGFLFIGVVVLLPLIIEKIIVIVQFLNHL